MNRFSKNVMGQLKHYVYALIDPRDKEIFYIGKGQNNRAFSHLSRDNSTEEAEKISKICEIRAAGYEPRVDILRYGLSNEEAHTIESTLIDAFGLEKLANIVRGHGAQFGRQTASEVERLLGGKDIEISEINVPVMMFFIHQSYSPTASEQELYDATRQYWYNVGEWTRTKDENGLYPYDIALAIVDSVIVRAYTIECWLPGGSTFSSRGQNYFHPEDKKWEFVGMPMDDFPYLGRRVMRNGQSIQAIQQGYSYEPAPRDLKNRFVG